MYPGYELSAGQTAYNNYNLSQSTARSASRMYCMPLRVCRTKGNQASMISIDVWSSNTIEQLKDKIAYYLRINVPLNKFFLEVYDKYDNQWKKIDDSDSSTTIDQLKLSPGNILSIEYDDRPISNNERSLYPASTSSTDQDLILKLCRKPMDKTEYKSIKISSYSTVAELRNQIYKHFNKVSQDQPIYVLNGDNWMKFGSDMDNGTLRDLYFQSYLFISIEPDDETANSKHLTGLCGLANLGSTCFMNSIFQCLSNIPEFNKKVLDFTDEVNAPIIDEYKKLMKNLWSGKYKYIDPSLLLNNIKDNLPRYDNYRQQDAQEFMNHFLHLIHAEFSSKESLITDLFYGQTQSTVKCLECHRTETTNESISFLPLPMSNYNQKSILYVKTDGEHRLVFIQIDVSIRTIGNLIDCFITQYESTLTARRIRAVQLDNNLFKRQYESGESLTKIRDEELALLECPEKSTDQRYVLCEFFDYSTDKPFRPPIVLVCPIRNCHYTHLSDQIDQLLGHLCSVTNAPVTACQLFWTDRRDKKYKLNRQDELPSLNNISIRMDAEWIDIYKVYNNINCSTDNSALMSLLADFFREEPLDDDYHCLKCAKPTKARQKSSLCSPLPKVLIIQLKRFTYDVYSNDKINTYISFPLYGLDLKEHIVKDNNNNNNNQQESNSSTKYNLVAVSNHIGSLISGHYTTYAKNIHNGNWYSFDDKFVRKLNSDNDIITKNAYILVYVQTT